MTLRAAMHSPRPPAPLTLALAGLVSLGVAMGIGRFAFTPLLPMMLAERSVDLPGASLLASANYLGYLLGALVCTFQPWIWSRLGLAPGVNGPQLVRLGLAATAVLTLGMALHLPVAWTLLRFTAGVASAVVFLYTAGFCLEQLTRRGVPGLGALIFIGPGLGIVLTGLTATALVQLQAPAAAGWAAFGLLAALLTGLVWRIFQASPGAAAPAPASGARAPGPAPIPAGTAEMSLLTLAYGLAGIGYIITATFLPVIARQALPGSRWLDLFWPLVGCGVMIGAAVASRLGAGGDLRWRLAVCYLIQAAGVAAGLVSPTLVGFVLGSLLVGLPFTAITFFAMQEARRVRPLQATSFMGLLTAAYGLGQIAGPPLAAGLVARRASPAAGFDIALAIATGLLGLGAVVYLLIARLYPLHRSES